jgi:hypothetical protein
VDDGTRSGENRTELIEFNEAEAGNLLVTPLGGDRYRLDETPIMVGPDPGTSEGDPELWWGDTIEAQRLASGALRYRATVARSPWRHWSWLLPREAIDSSGLTAFTELITKSGGLWERIFQGILIVHLPEDSTLDPGAELAACLR